MLNNYFYNYWYFKHYFLNRSIWRLYKKRHKSRILRSSWRISYMHVQKRNCCFNLEKANSFSPPIIILKPASNPCNSADLKPCQEALFRPLNSAPNKTGEFIRVVELKKFIAPRLTWLEISACMIIIRYPTMHVGIYTAIYSGAGMHPGHLHYLVI